MLNLKSQIGIRAILFRIAMLSVGIILLVADTTRRRSGTVVSPEAGDLILPQGGGFNPAGAINKHGQTVIPFSYKNLNRFNQFGLAIAENEKGEYGCLDRNGHMVIPFEWDWINDFDVTGTAWAGRKFETVLLNTSGRIIEHYRFAFRPPFNRQGLAWAHDGHSHWRLINRNGDVVSSERWDTIGDFDNDGFAVVSIRPGNGERQQFGIIDETGKYQIEPVWLGIYPQRVPHSPGAVRKKVESTVFDKQEWCLVEAESGYGWIDRTSNVVSPLKWKFASRFIEFEDGSEALAAVMDECGSGYMNRKNEIVIATTFVRTGVFDSEGFAPAAIGDPEHPKWGWINRSGEFVIPPEWDEVEPFAPNDLAVVCRNGHRGVIDRHGDIRVEPRWYSVSVWNTRLNQSWRNDGIHAVRYSPDEWHILDLNGRKIQDLGVPPKCWSYGFDPALCEDPDFGFHRYFYDRSAFGSLVHKLANKLPGSMGRAASRTTESLDSWSLEYEVLDNSGTTIWSSLESRPRGKYADLVRIAGVLCIAISMCPKPSSLRHRQHKTT